MTTAASTNPQSAPLSRLARLGVNLGLKHLSHAGPSRQPRPYTDANESEWYIPYNGPSEHPKGAAMGGTSDRGSWTEFVANSESAHNHAERNPSALGYGGASSSGHGHEFGHTYGSSAHGHAYDSHYEERGRGFQLSPLSRYSETLATLGGGERHAHVVASPTTSPISTRRGPLSAFHGPDATGSGIGEVPVPLQRFGQSSNSGHDHDLHEYAFPHGPSSSALAPAPAPTVSPRESVASFWTFGRSASKKSPPINASGGLPSVESRQSTSTPQTALQPIVIRDRSATISSQRGDPFKGQHMRPRAYTSAPSAPSVLPPTLIVPESHGYYTDNRPESDRANSPYQRHPYATAVSPTGHRQHSQLMRPPEYNKDAPEHRSPALNLNVPFLSSKKSFTSLRRAATNLKTSVSTPNLRGEKQRGTQRTGGSSAESPGTPSAGSTGAKWLSAETWCDALLFPRPRFRLRSAHVISPPTSPVAGTPPYSAPAQTQAQPRTLKKSFFGAKNPVDPRKTPQAPLSTPPNVLHSNPDPPPVAPPSAPVPARAAPGPSQQNLRPPRPKSFAKDDLALPSPVPSLSTVLRQNEEFDKERQMWKSKASRSFGNKRSRSLSRSRLKAKAKLTGQAEEPDAELALSFDFLATRAFHGSQALKPSIHFAPTPPASTARSGVGTNTTSTGLNTTSTHSRNTSNISRGGSATSRSNHSHARKESWSKSALKTAKNTANVAGLCGFNDDLSPADEKVMALDGRLKQDRIKQPHGNGENDVSHDNVLVISAQNSSYLSPHQQKVAGPSLSPVPSDISGESIARTGVGIALSTPTALIDHPFQFTDHPYATKQNESVPRSAEYAGPHPSHISRTTDSVANEPTLADISARHRRPAAPLRTYVDTSSLHPYAAVERRSRPFLRVGSIPAPSKMFADVGTGSIREVLPDDIQYSPYSVQYSAKSSKHNSDALGVEEALSLAFSHGEMDGSDPGRRVEQRSDESEDFGAQSGSQELIAPPVLRSAFRERDSQFDETVGHESWQTSQDDDNNGNLLVPTPMSTSSYKQNSSPGQVSYESSPMASPRQFKKFDDMEDYSDLFYRPGQQPMVAGTPGANNGNSSGSSDQPTPPSEVVRTLSRDVDSGFQRPMLARSNSALTRLRQQLSEEYGANIDDRHILGAETALRRHVSEVVEVDEELDDAHAIVSQGSSPPGATLPLRVQMNRPESAGPGNLIPEDVESSRASSILERYETEEGTEVYYRLGEVPALATPDPITSSATHRVSAHVSYIDNTPPSNHRSLSPDDQRQRERRSRPSLLPPMSATTSTTRGSYMTSTSSTSHISQLSDFPVPPGQPALTPGSIIQSYFGNSPEPPNRADPRLHSRSPERGREVRRSRRTTFGPVPEDSS